MKRSLPSEFSPCKRIAIKQSYAVYLLHQAGSKPSAKSQLAVAGTGDQVCGYLNIKGCVDRVLTTMDKINDADAFNLSLGIHTSFNPFAPIASETVDQPPEVIELSRQPCVGFTCTASQNKGQV